MTELAVAEAGVSATEALAPFEPWSCCAQQPGAITHPDQLHAVSGGWLPAAVPGTVAAALQKSHSWDFSRPRDLDAEDWWYRTAFRAPDLPGGHPCHLCFDGLATLAEVWLNGRRVLTTDNMFRGYRVNVADDLRPENELVLGFRSLAEDLKRKRPRPRWKTNLVNNQQLRWHRTSLLGRIPGWSPPAPPVGPWRAVRLDARPFAVSALRLTSRMEGGVGVVGLQAKIDSAAPLRRAVLEVGGHQVDAALRRDGQGWCLEAALRLEHPPLWWPHTHGEQPLSQCILLLDTRDGHYTVPCGSIGFRQLHVQREGGFSIEVNGVPVYCRGACWTVSDILTLTGTEHSLARDLHLARDAGVNMLRVGGTMVYESDAFYQLCDELGILVWQDFMFANMDYPVEEPGFAASIEAEADYQLERLSPHPCVAVLCGNSEVEQQAAMRGAPRETWRNRWFGNRLPELCAAHLPEVAYVPSTPSGGALPFHVREGIAHYYGVGAYLRSAAELRQADVKFAAECLAFANVPEPEMVNAVMGGGAPAPHHPRWKERIPRDTGAGWDFEDVRDHYLQQFFAVDPVKLRSFDTGRYLQLGRVISGEMMAQVFAEWRSGHTRNGGGLVWFYKDLWPGAGFGILDSSGLPKAAYYYLRRCWRPRQITLTDEGLDGLHLHVTNEAAEPLRGHVEIFLLADSHIVVARNEVPCLVPARGKQTLAADSLLNGFFDVTYAYRFGPPKHDLAIATLLDEQRRVLSEACYFVRPREPSFLPAARLEAETSRVGEGRYEVTVRSDDFLQSVSFDVPGFLPDDNYFHLPPTRRKVVRFTALKGDGGKFRGHLEALNLRQPVLIPLKGL